MKERLTDDGPTDNEDDSAAYYRQVSLKACCEKKMQNKWLFELTLPE